MCLVFIIVCISIYCLKNNKSHGISHRKRDMQKCTKINPLLGFLSGYHVKPLVFQSLSFCGKILHGALACGRPWERVGVLYGECVLTGCAISLLLPAAQRDETEAGGGRQQMQHPLEAPEICGALLHALLLAFHLPGQHQAQVCWLHVQCLQELLLLPEAREGVDLLRLPANQVSGQVDLTCPLGAQSFFSQVGASRAWLVSTEYWPQWRDCRGVQNTTWPLEREGGLVLPSFIPQACAGFLGIKLGGGMWWWIRQIA